MPCACTRKARDRRRRLCTGEPTSTWRALRSRIRTCSGHTELPTDRIVGTTTIDVTSTATPAGANKRGKRSDDPQPAPRMARIRVAGRRCIPNSSASISLPSPARPGKTLSTCTANCPWPKISAPVHRAGIHVDRRRPRVDHPPGVLVGQPMRARHVAQLCDATTRPTYWPVRARPRCPDDRTSGPHAPVNSPTSSACVVAASSRPARRRTSRCSISSGSTPGRCGACVTCPVARIVGRRSTGRAGAPVVNATVRLDERPLPPNRYRSGVATFELTATDRAQGVGEERSAHFLLVSYARSHAAPSEKRDSLISRSLPSSASTAMRSIAEET